MFDNRDSIDFRNSEIPKIFRSLFIPTLLGMMFNVAFTLTDGIFVGHGVGPEGLACVNLVAPIMMVVTGLGMLFGIGGSVVAAIHLGKGNEKAARINVTQAFGCSIAVAVLMGTVFYCFPDDMLKLLGVSGNLMPLAKEYYMWFIPTCLFLMFQLVGEFMIRLDGSPRYAMYANIIPAVVNIVLDYVFIIPMQMGLKGAALATDIGTAVGMAMAFYYMFFRCRTLRFYRVKGTKTSVRLTVRNVAYMAKLGFSAFIGEIAISVMMLTGNLVFGRYLGDEGIAAYSVICYIFPLVYMIYCAVAQSAQPIISYNHGAEQPERSRKTFVHSVSISLAFGAAMTLVSLFLAPAVVSVFIGRASSAAQLASGGLPLYSLGFVFVAFNVSAIGYYQSTEQATWATVLMVLRGIVLLVAAFLLLPLAFGQYGLWLAVPVAEAITTLVIAVRYIFSRR
ncbi:MAG: MATE family efflux transporter [Bacteroidales bacterium]|nr:MATE family efflux transporter [Bacteroidales bacterium]